MKLLAIPLVCIFAAACGSGSMNSLDSGAPRADSDVDLYSLTQASTPWTFYKHSSTPIARTSQPHPETRALVRYNERAATQLDANGKVKADANFPDSSIIVKELSNGGAVSTYAVMMKLRGASVAGVDGWVWAEFGAKGVVRYSTTGRGGNCTSCHSVGIDYTRMNDSHP